MKQIADLIRSKGLILTLTVSADLCKKDKNANYK